MEAHLVNAPESSLIQEINRIDLQPDEVLAIRLSRVIEPDLARRIIESIPQPLQDRIVLLAPDTELTVIKS